MQATIPCFICRPRLKVRDAANDTIFNIKKKGACSCPFPMCKAEFKVDNSQGEHVGGVIKKKFDGLAKSILMDGESACFAELLLTDLMLLKIIANN